MMNRSNFIKLAIGGTTMMALNPLYNWSKDLKETDGKMPVLFIGHGSPMNGIEDNAFSKTWVKLGTEIPKPKAVLVVSAHWLTNGTHITAMEAPKTIHDFGGFPQALFDVLTGRHAPAGRLPFDLPWSGSRPAPRRAPSAPRRRRPRTSRARTPACAPTDRRPCRMPGRRLRTPASGR